MTDLFLRVSAYFEHSDERGAIKGLLNEGKWEEFNIVSTTKGVSRGGHYHKETVECFLLLSGQVEVDLEDVRANSGSRQQRIKFKSGDVFLIPPMILHVFHALEDCTWINILSKRHNPKRPDMYT